MAEEKTSFDYNRENKIKTAVLSGIAGLVVGLVIGTFFSTHPIEPDISDKPTIVGDAQSAVAEDDFKMQKFSGKGTSATNRIELPQGVYVVKSLARGDSNFIVKLVNKDDGDYEPIVNEIGNYDGSSTVIIDSAGVYILDVVADGEWTIEVTK